MLGSLNVNESVRPEFRSERGMTRETASVDRDLPRPRPLISDSNDQTYFRNRRRRQFSG